MLIAWQVGNVVRDRYRYDHHYIVANVGIYLI